VVQATTSSLEALKAFSLGEQQRARGAEADSVPFFKRAIELDPNFAVAYARLGSVYNNFGESELAREQWSKAYELHNRASELERLYIEGHYHDGVTRNLEKAREIYELWARTYPRDSTPVTNLAFIADLLGQYEKAIEWANKAVKLDPRQPFGYNNLTGAYFSLGRLEEAKAVAKQQMARIGDNDFPHFQLALVAYLQGEPAAMEQQLKWFKGKGPFEAFALGLQAGVATYEGRLRDSDELARQGAAMARRYNLTDNAAGFLAWRANDAAIVGDESQARQWVNEVMRLKPSLDVQGQVAATLALIGEASRAEAIAKQLEQQFPQATLLNALSLPAIRAAIELHRNRPEQAIATLRSAAPYELSSEGPGLGSIYLRGQAYLRLEKGEEAAAEFQKIPAHPGVDPLSILHPLAHLGLARAHALSGDKPAARKSYQDFLALWQHADAGIPILRQAKAEYAKLQ
jgi:tetratricopeptide (TPR) repeat protein